VQVEAQFALKGVTASSTKFYYCVSSFNQETANQVLDLIKNPPSSDPYEALKSRLLRLFALDDYQRYEAISYVEYARPASSWSQTVFLSSWSLSEEVACRRPSSPTERRFFGSYSFSLESRRDLSEQSFLFNCLHGFQRPGGCCQRREIFTYKPLSSFSNSSLQQPR